MIKAVSRVSIFEHIMFINCTIATSICYNSFIYNPKFFNCIHFELACYFDTDVEIIRLQRRKKQLSYTYLTREKIIISKRFGQSACDLFMRMTHSINSSMVDGSNITLGFRLHFRTITTCYENETYFTQQFQFDCESMFFLSKMKRKKTFSRQYLT